MGLSIRPWFGDMTRQKRHHVRSVCFFLTIGMHLGTQEPSGRGGAWQEVAMGNSLWRLLTVYPFYYTPTWTYYLAESNKLNVCVCFKKIH